MSWMSVGLEMDWDLPIGGGQFHEESLDENNRDDEDNLEDEVARDFENYHPQFQHYREDFPLNHDRRGLGYQPLDELTKRMKVDMLDFYGQL